MRVIADKDQKNQHVAATDKPSRKTFIDGTRGRFRDNRSEAAQFRKLQETADKSSRQAVRLESMRDRCSGMMLSQRQPQPKSGGPAPGGSENDAVQLRKVGMFGIEAEVSDGYFRIAAPRDKDGGNLIRDQNVSFEEYELANFDGHVSVTLDGEVNRETETHYVRSYTVEYIQRPVDVELEQEEALGGVADAWKNALIFWQAHIENNQALKTMLGDWYHQVRTWRGEQFEGREGTPGLKNEEGEEAQFDWTNEAYTTGILTKTADPGVSMQMTAGSTLLGLLEVYMETVAILGSGTPAEGKAREDLDILRRNSEEKPVATKLTNFIFLLSQYIAGNGNTMDDRPRPYAKEYVSLMSRTSLDLVYRQLDAAAKDVFEAQVVAYLFNQDQNPLLKYFKRTADTRVFTKDAQKEDVSKITIEQLLLSIIKKKRAQLGEALVHDDAAEAGDVLVQNNLAGMGEINTNAQAMLAKFGLQNAGEMMTGIPGMIFENRAAKSHKLSALPDLFLMLANSLRQVNVAHDQALRARQPAPMNVQKPVQGPADKGNCFLTTACVTQRGLPDNCEELQVLRTFRDEFLAPLPIGTDLIECYYRQAPGIVEAINASAKRHITYDRIYQVIRFCVDAIKSGHDAIALAAYCEMVFGLERAFGSEEHNL